MFPVNGDNPAVFQQRLNIDDVVSIKRIDVGAVLFLDLDHKPGIQCPLLLQVADQDGEFLNEMIFADKCKWPDHSKV